ncbi:MAG: hypothetical protein K8S14_07860 [Actinomycetia bacterium]|nr:hypothetical protein [Actinomycetes bacterium]
MSHLWKKNEPARFWQCYPEIPQSQWLAAAREASPVLGCLDQHWNDFDTLLQLTLGEGQHGIHHWQLGWKKEFYYQVKPWLPRLFTRMLRQFQTHFAASRCLLDWPIEKRYVLFQWELIRCLLIQQDQLSLNFIHFWPHGKQFALVLTHDVETINGQRFVRTVVDLEESLGFRSSFNFVPERYELDHDLLFELRERGFEVGVHGLCHDGKLFSSQQVFEQRASRINHYMKQFQAAGFRSPLTMRQPEWMQALDIDYDLSFFDTDPYEPISGGTMSIWPFWLGRFVELPYTLVQDYTLIKVLKQLTPRIWLDKVDFIRRHFGMALINTHPDYLQEKTTWQVYHDFLLEMRKLESDWWHSLPKQVANWWRKRHSASVHALPIDSDLSSGQIMLTQNGIEIC